MLRNISEPDWKIFRQLYPVALERFCEKVLSEIDKLRSKENKTYHERYLSIFKLIEKRDKQLGDAFDNPRRSAALEQLLWIKRHKLLSEEEMSRFSPETLEIIHMLMEY